jgi:outer membrane protein assembly factor BamE (lipoprotein component of BamABCDE complex)
VVLDPETAISRNFDLALLDCRIIELFDVAAFDAHDVIVVATLLQLEHRFAAFEVMADEQPGLFELREHAVNRSEPRVRSFLQQRLVYVFGRKVANFAFLEDLQDPQARQGSFETYRFEIGGRAQEVACQEGRVWAMILVITFIATVRRSADRCTNATRSSSMRKLLPLLIVLAGCKQVPMLPGITPHKIDIQQGNYVTQDMVAKLKPGMSKSQVRFALGTPLIVDPFHNDRWDYVYVLQKGGRLAEQRHIVVVFQNDKLVRIDGDIVPSAAAAAPEVTKPVSPGATAAGAGAVENSAAPGASTAPGAVTESSKP